VLKPARRRNRGLDAQQKVAVAFVIGLFMDLLDTTIVNVAVPTLQDEFGVDETTIEWVITGYLLSLAVWIPASGWIGDRFGTKKTFLFAMAQFTVASALCGLAWDEHSLIAFRVLQGVGGGMLAPVGTAMLFRAYPPWDRAKASAILAIPTILAPAMGPVLGGFLVTHASWRWIFLVNVPVGIVGFVFAARALEEHTEPNPGRFDMKGFVLSGSGLALLLFALARGPSQGWASLDVLLPGITGVIAFVLLVRTELAVPEPLLDLRLMGDRLFRQANIAMVALTGSLLGILFLLPLFLQGMRGLSALESGLTTFPQALGVLVMLGTARRLYPRLGPRRMMLFGATANVFITLCFTLVGLGTSLWWIRLIVFSRGATMAFVMIPMQVASFATVPAAKTGRASSLSNTNRQVGSALGVAVLATVLASRTRALTGGVQSASALLDARVTAFHQAMVASAAIACLGVIASWFIHDEDAAITLGGHPAATDEPGEPLVLG
jgi:EmrB/QacA subfamily drug resistance transporter